MNAWSLLAAVAGALVATALAIVAALAWHEWEHRRRARRRGGYLS